MREHVIPLPLRPELERYIKIDNCGHCKGNDALLKEGRTLPQGLYVLHLFVRGKGYFSNGLNQAHSFSDNTVILSYPGLFQSITPQPQKNLEHWYVMCSGELIKHLFEPLIVNKVEIFSIRKNELYLKKYIDILHLCRIKTQSSVHQANSLLYDLIIETTLLHQSPDNKIEPSLVEKFIGFLGQNLQQRHLDYGDFLKPLKIGKSRFVNYFKKETGLTPHQYCLSHKITEAKTLLLQTDKSIKEISNLVGFEDELYFSRLFKRREGLSPSQYRKKFL